MSNLPRYIVVGFMAMASVNAVNQMIIKNSCSYSAYVYTVHHAVDVSDSAYNTIEPGKSSSDGF